jgi:diacylglycerol O-acyltransferase / wax synthase
MRYHERLTEAERMFLDLDDGHVHMHAAAVCRFEAGPLGRERGGVDVEAIRARVASQLFRIPRYRQRIVHTPVEGHPVWVDDPRFNLEYHVRHTRLPEPGDERQLKRLCGQIASQELDREKPLWELWVVEGLEDGRFALVAKVHQCLSEQIWGIDLLVTLLSRQPDKVTEPGPVWLPRAEPTGLQLVRDALLRRATTPFRALREIGGVIRAPRERAAALGATFEALLGPGPASETPLNRPIGPHRRFDWLVTERAALLSVAESFGTHLDAVALAVLAGALGRFLALRGTTPAELRALDFRAALPTERGLEAGAAPDAAGEWRVVTLPLAESDPAERLRRVIHGLENAVRVGYGPVSSIAPWLWPGAAAALARLQLERRTSNLTVSLVDGPDAPLHLLGARLTDVHPLLPLVPHQALRISLLSYAGALHWGFNSDWDLMPDLHELVVATGEGVEALLHTVAAGSA